LQSSAEKTIYGFQHALKKNLKTAINQFKFWPLCCCWQILAKTEPNALSKKQNKTKPEKKQNKNKNENEIYKAK